MVLRLTSVMRVLRKEIREGLRDRSLVISVILVPLFLYPIIGFGGFQVVQVIRGMSEQRVTTIAVGPGVPALIVENLTERERFEIVDPPATLATDELPFPVAEEYRRHRARSDEAPLHAMLLWAAGDTAAVYFDESRDRSRAAASAVQEAIDEWARERAVVRLAEVGLPESDYDLWELEVENTASAREIGRQILSKVLPMFLLLMLATGTFYSTLDTVVGERERGTLETILTSPVGRGEILVGKFLFVVIASVTALLLNLVSLTVFVGFVLKLLGTEKLELTIGPVAFLLILVTAILSACVLAAVLMVVSIPSKTYREGQAVLTPAYFLTMIPGFMVAISSQSFGMKQAFVPFLNSVALFKSVLLGEMPVGPIVVTLAVMAALAGIALAVASRIVGREDVFLEPKMTLRALLTGKRGETA